MKRRDALRTILLAAGANVAPVRWTLDPKTHERSAETSRLARSLPRGRAHVVVADPNMSPDAVLTPIVECLQDAGRSVQTVRAGVVPDRIVDVLVLREPEIRARQFWLELKELDRKARHSNAPVIVSRQKQSKDDTVWIPRFGQASGWVIYVHEAVLNEPPEVLPSHYRVPVEVTDRGDRIASFFLIEPVSDRP